MKLTDEVTATVTNTTAVAVSTTATSAIARLPPPRRSASTASITTSPTAAFSHAARENENRIPTVTDETSASFTGVRSCSRRGRTISSSRISAAGTRKAP